MTANDSPIVIRDRGPGDDRRIAELAVESIEFHATTYADIRDAPSIEDMQQEFATLTPAPELYLRVAETEGELVGFLSASLRPAPAGGVERFSGPTVYVGDVAVTAGARRRGIASLLMADVEAWARSHGACAITLSVHQGNPATHLYERHGYAPTWQTYRKNL